MRSPWQRALGESFDTLDPGLVEYFAQIPDGSVGRGSGVFERVGTSRRWLWPVLSVLAVDGIVFPVWEKGVPFTVENRPTAVGTVRSTRTFFFERGTRTMTDEIGVTRQGLTDRLGTRGILAATFSATVTNGRLQLRSRDVTARIGPVRIRLGALSPRVTLVERREGELQQVSLVLEAPLLGRIYEYAGSFSYSIEGEA